MRTIHPVDVVRILSNCDPCQLARLSKAAAT